MKFKFSYVLILVMSLGLVSCSDDGYGIIGNGQVIEEVREIGEFTKLAVNGPFQVTVEASESNQLTISGESNIIPHIATEVRNGYLVLDPSYHETLYINKPLIVTIPAQILDEIELNGTGKIDAPAFEVDELHVHLRGSGEINSDVNAETLTAILSGAGEINLKGAATHGDIYVEGTGDLNAFETQLQYCEIKVYGMADANVAVAVELDVEIDGSGDVTYIGEPDVDSDIEGSGQVRKKE